MNAIVKKHGRKTIVWEGMNPLLLDKDVLIYAWGSGHRELLKANREIVNVPWTISVYSSQAGNYGWNIWQMCGENRPCEQLDRTELMKGAMLVLWERNGHEAIQLLRRNTPARAEVTYHPDYHSDDHSVGGRSYAEFRRRFEQTDRLLDKLILPVAIKPGDFARSSVCPSRNSPTSGTAAGGRLFRDKLTVTLTSLAPRPGESIHYTLDGSEPTPKSPAYSGPFTITKANARHYQPDVNEEPIAEVVLKARAFDGDRRRLSRETRYRYDYIAEMPRVVRLKLFELPADGQPVSKLPDFSKLKPLSEGSEAWINMNGMPQVRVPQYFAGQWRHARDRQAGRI